MSVDVRNVPPWKLALLERKRRQEEDERRRSSEEEARLARMPAWKRDILSKKQSQKNSLVFLSKGSKTKLDNSELVSNPTGVPASPDSGNSPRVSAVIDDSVLTAEESEPNCQQEGGASDEHLVPIKQNPWVRTDPMAKKTISRVTCSSTNPAVTNNENSSPRQSDSSPRTNNDIENSQSVFEEEQEFSYGRGFVHKLLAKFTHLSESPVGSLSPKHRALSTESLLDEPKVSHISPRSLSTSGIATLENHRDDVHVPSSFTGNKAQSMDSLSPSYSNRSADKLTPNGSHSEHGNGYILDKNMHPTADDVDHIKGHRNSGDIHGDVGEDDLPKLNTVSSTRSLFEGSSQKQKPAGVPRLDLDYGSDQGSYQGDWSPRTSSTSVQSPCNGSLGSGSEEASPLQTPERKPHKPVSDDVLKNVRTAGKVWYSTGNSDEASDQVNHTAQQGSHTAQQVNHVNHMDNDYMSGSGSSRVADSQNTVLSPPSMKKRRAAPNPPHWTPVSHNSHGDVKNADVERKPPQSTVKTSQRPNMQLELENKPAVETAMSPSYKELYFSGKVQSPSYKDLYLSPSKSKSDALVSGVGGPFNGDAQPTLVSLDTSHTTDSVKATLPTADVITSAPVAEKSPAVAEPASPVVSPQNALDKSPSFTSAKDLFAKEAANATVLPIPRPRSKAHTAKPSHATSSEAPVAAPRRASVERPSSIVSSNSKVTLEDVTRNNFTNPAKDTGKTIALEKKAKASTKRSQRQGPGSLLIRPASNLVLGSSKMAGLSSHMDKYNDVKMGVFQPPKKRPTLYGAYDDDYEYDDIPVTNIDDVLGDAPITHIDDVSVSGASPRQELDADTHRKHISKKFEFVGAGVTLGRSLLSKTKVRKLQVSFNDSATSEYEYESMQFLLATLPPEPGDYDYPNPNEKLQSPTEDVTINTTLMSTPGLGGATGSLANYRSKASMDYQFGMQMPRDEVRPEAKEERPHDVGAVDDMQIKPADESETSAWSDANSSDMLF